MMTRTFLSSAHVTALVLLLGMAASTITTSAPLCMLPAAVQPVRALPTTNTNPSVERLFDAQPHMLDYNYWAPFFHETETVIELFGVNYKGADAIQQLYEAWQPYVLTMTSERTTPAHYSNEDRVVFLETRNTYVGPQGGCSVTVNTNHIIVLGEAKNKQTEEEAAATAAAEENAAEDATHTVIASWHMTSDQTAEEIQNALLCNAFLGQDKIKQLINDQVDRFNQQDVFDPSFFAASFAENGIHDFPGNREPMVGKQSIVEHYQGIKGIRQYRSAILGAVQVTGNTATFMTSSSLTSFSGCSVSFNSVFVRRFNAQGQIVRHTFFHSLPFADIFEALNCVKEHPHAAKLKTFLSEFYEKKENDAFAAFFSPGCAFERLDGSTADFATSLQSSVSSRDSLNDVEVGFNYAVSREDPSVMDAAIIISYRLQGDNAESDKRQSTTRSRYQFNEEGSHVVKHWALPAVEAEAQADAAPPASKQEL